jgi:hypothetical protein
VEDVVEVCGGCGPGTAGRDAAVWQARRHVATATRAGSVENDERTDMACTATTVVDADNDPPVGRAVDGRGT